MCDKKWYNLYDSKLFMEVDKSEGMGKKCRSSAYNREEKCKMWSGILKDNICRKF
jgi:hypothetical protein